MCNKKKIGKDLFEVLKSKSFLQISFTNYCSISQNVIKYSNNHFQHTEMLKIAAI